MRKKLAYPVIYERQFVRFSMQLRKTVENDLKQIKIGQQQVSLHNYLLNLSAS